METILIKHIRKGDVKSFEKLFSMHYNVLFAYANKFLNDRNLSKEIVNDAFLRLWQRRQDIRRNIKTLKPYLFQIVHNLCINKLNESNRKNTIIVSDFSFLDENIDCSSWDYDELTELMMNAIKKLPPERQRIFTMSRICEMKNREIAEELNLSIKTVENQISRALAFLRKELKQHF